MGKIPDSIKELRIAVKANPGFGELKRKLGSAYLCYGNYELAIELLTESLQMLDKKNTKLVAKALNLPGRAKMEVDDFLIKFWPESKVKSSTM